MQSESLSANVCVALLGAVLIGFPIGTVQPPGSCSG